MANPESRGGKHGRTSKVVAGAATAAVLFAGGFGAGKWHEQREADQAERRAEASVRWLRLDWRPVQLTQYEGTPLHFVIQGTDTDEPCRWVRLIGMPRRLLEDQLAGRPLGIARWTDSQGGADNTSAEVGLIGSQTLLWPDERLARPGETPSDPSRNIVAMHTLGVLSCSPETVSLVAFNEGGEPRSLQGLESVGSITLGDLGSPDRVFRPPVVAQQ